MSGNMQGMDVAEVDRIGRQLRTEAENVSQLLARVAKQVDVADRAWEGKDAERFVADWRTKRAQLQTIQTQLNQLGQKAINEAAQQRRTSG